MVQPENKKGRSRTFSSVLFTPLTFAVIHTLGYTVTSKGSVSVETKKYFLSRTLPDSWCSDILKVGSLGATLSKADGEQEAGLPQLYL